MMLLVPQPLLLLVDFDDDDDDDDDADDEEGDRANCTTTLEKLPRSQFLSCLLPAGKITLVYTWFGYADFLEKCMTRRQDKRKQKQLAGATSGRKGWKLSIKSIRNKKGKEGKEWRTVRTVHRQHRRKHLFKQPSMGRLRHRLLGV